MHIKKMQKYLVCNLSVSVCYELQILREWFLENTAVSECENQRDLRPHPGRRRWGLSLAGSNKKDVPTFKFKSAFVNREFQVSLW